MDARNEAAALLLRAWREGLKLDGLPSTLRPRTRAEGYAVQVALTAQAGAPLYGWKIAGTNEAGRRHINVGAPLAGPIFADRVLEPGQTVPMAGNGMRVAEPELAFRMARDLPPRPVPYTSEEVVAAAGTLHPAIEIPDSRYAAFVEAGEAQLIADAACAHLFVPGPAAPDGWRDMDLAALRVSVRVSDGAAQTGEGRNVLGDPRTGLTWLVNELSGLGITLEAGQVVTTGVVTSPLAIAPGDVVRAEFGPLGRIEVRFGD